MYKRLEVLINGPFASLYDVKIDFENKVAVYTKQDAIFLGEETFDISLGSENLGLFKEKLEEYNISSWKDEYTDLNFKTGYKWEIKLVSRDFEKQSKGLVAVPDEWDNMCKQISLLLGRKFG